MSRTEKRLTRKEFYSPQTWLHNPLSADEQRRHYLMSLHRANQCLYEELMMLKIGVLNHFGTYILPSGTEVKLDYYDELEDRWVKNLDFDVLNSAWDAGINLLKSTPKELPFNSGNKKWFIKENNANRIFPVN